MSTLTFLFLLVSLLGIAAAVIAVLTDKLVERWQSTDLQERINRARWPDGSK